MIGVYCRKAERAVVREFFELFKSPWGFFSSTGAYDVILSTRADIPLGRAKLILLYSSSATAFDRQMNVAIRKIDGGCIRQKEMCLPIYGKMAILGGQGTSLLRTDSDNGVVALALHQSRIKVVRVGYDLFQEIAFLVNEGQPAEKAAIPTLDFHIALLRNWILAAGLPLVEIPPLPFGFEFFACLTHDVDFAGIRRHVFDHTMWGFVYRGLFGSLSSFLNGRIGLTELAKNWMAVTKLPFVLIGLGEDFWEHFDEYAEVEKERRSTFFLIPYKGRAGDESPAGYQNGMQSRRAAAYDIDDVQHQVSELTKKGFEIGLHGIDSWWNLQAALREKDRVLKATGQTKVGVRMHWLYYNQQSPSVLDKAGFEYDATLGYNETVGFRNGTTQVFRPLGVRKLLELPLSIQDTALFYPRRLNLSRVDARQLCSRLLEMVRSCGGVLTVSWHERSLRPERLWGEFYVWFLGLLQAGGACFADAEQVVEWFRLRRTITFGESRYTDRKCEVHLDGHYRSGGPRPFLRLNVPAHFDRRSKNEEPAFHIDLPWSGQKSLKFSMKGEGRS